MLPLEPIGAKLTPSVEPKSDAAEVAADWLVAVTLRKTPE